MNWEYLVSTGRINLQKLAHIAGFSHSASIDDRISAVLATPSVLLPPETSKRCLHLLTSWPTDCSANDTGKEFPARFRG